MRKYPSIKPFGDKGILIDWPEVINSETNEKVVNCGRAIEKANISGIMELIIAYQSITVIYDCLHADYPTLEGVLNKVIDSYSNEDHQSNLGVIEVPVCYDRVFASDSQEVESLTGLSWSKVIDLHSNQTYRVYMTGFTPGFAYLGTVPGSLEVPRKKVPRTNVQQGSIALAGKQTGIYSLPSPGGWQVIGRTPMNLANLDGESKFKFQPGDKVIFKPISREKFEKWE